MKSPVKIFLFVSATAFLFSCGDVLKNTYSKKTAEGDLERILAISKLDSSEYELLTDYMLKNGLIEPDLKHIDQTYADLLERAKKDKLKNDLAKANRGKITGNKRQFMSDHQDHLHKALLMVPELSEIRKDWSNKNTFFYKMVFVNPGYKTVRAFRGKFSFYDLFDTELKTVNFTFNDSIPSLDTARHTAAIDFNHMSSNTIYVTSDYKDLKVVWQPTKILFSDGTTME